MGFNGIERPERGCSHCALRAAPRVLAPSTRVAALRSSPIEINRHSRGEPAEAVYSSIRDGAVSIDVHAIPQKCSKVRAMGRKIQREIIRAVRTMVRMPAHSGDVQI